MKHLLQNIAWHALSGPQQRFSCGTADARRYAPGFSPILACRDPACPDFAALAGICAPGERFYFAGWTGAAPAGWQIESESVMDQMVWNEPMPAADGAPAPTPLGPDDAPAALELASLTRPGPFGPRTIELGEYFGFFDGQRLVAMAGERMQAGNLREISGVCTHPDFQGQGLARRLMNALIGRQMQRGELPFLHVMRENTGAHAAYLRMGFLDQRETPVRVVARC
jgi:ribosomal protein S18 acetylase RimI-like enzyme